MKPSATRYPQAPRIAVGALVIRDETVLLVKRGQAPSRGKWAIPGGSVELGETLQQAAEREILEETGVRIRALAPVHTFDYIERDKQENIRFHYVIVDLAAEYIDGEIKPGDDAAGAGWIPFAELKELDMNQSTRAFLSTCLQGAGREHGTDATR